MCPTLCQQLAQWQKAAVQAGRKPAVLAGNGVASLRAASAIHALGWVPGRELGVIGIDETDWAPLVGPGLTTVAQPTDALGQAAAQCLEAGKGEAVCMKELQVACKGLAIGKYCGMKHAH